MNAIYLGKSRNAKDLIENLLYEERAVIRSLIEDDSADSDDLERLDEIDKLLDLE